MNTPRFACHRTLSAGFATLALISATSTAALGQTSTAPQQVNAEARAGVSRNADTAINSKAVGLTLSGLVWGNHGLEFDLSIGKHEQYTSTTPNGTLHYFYAVDDALALGAYFTAEDRRPGNSYFFGAEMAYEQDGIGAQVYAAYRQDISASTTGHRIGASASYAPSFLPDLTLTAAGVRDRGEPLSRHYAYVGADYAVTDAFHVTSTLGQIDTGATIAGAGIVVKLGKGVRFGPRDTFANYFGY